MGGDKVNKIVIIVPGLPFDFFELGDNVILVSEEYVNKVTD